MRLEHYEVEISDRAFTFEFNSVGPKGRIRKIIQFAPVAGEALFNLGFGDKNLETGDFNDVAVTDNGDTEKVLATVTTIVYRFCDRFPSTGINATGSTPARTRLYRMGINKYYHLAIKDFYIFGQRPDDEWETFQKGRDYQAFVVDYDKFTYNPELDKYDNVVLFPEKVTKAKEAIKHPGFQKLMDSLKEKEAK